MIRRFSAALIGLALFLPIFAIAPVAAHDTTGVVNGFKVVFAEQGDDEIVGWVVNHTDSRRVGTQVTVTWDAATDIVESHPVFVTNLAPHNASPFKVNPTADVTGLPILSVTASGSSSSVIPSGGLHVEPCVFTAPTDVICNGSITNDGSVAAADVEVYATRGSTTTSTDAAESANIPTIAAGATVPYSITFEAGSDGIAEHLIAKTNSGTFHTSWNNFFGDLNATSESFVDEIAFMADEGITFGCGNANFCPRNGVTRAQMAAFLDRAIAFDIEPAVDQGFTDLAGQSPAFIQSINNLAANGVTAGCSTSPKKYCPNAVVTRGQMSKFIVIAYELAVVQTDSFVDDDGHFSEDYNDTMASLGITSGCASEPARYCPGSNVLREQMAVFITRAEQQPGS